MATGRYKLQKDNDWNAIFYRFKQGKQFDIISSIGIEVPRGRWSDAKQEILATQYVDYKKVNVKLKEFNTFIIKEYENSKLSDELDIINPKWLKERIDTFFVRESQDEEVNKKTFFTNFIDLFIAESHTKKTRNNTPVKKRTIQHYNTTLKKIKAFEERIGKKIKLSDVNLTFHSHFIHFLENVQHLNPNTIGGYIDDVKLFIRNADGKGLKVSNEHKLKNFYSPSNKTQDVYFKEEETIKMLETEFEQDYLDNSRDWLIIGIRTGLRVSDLLPLLDKVIVDEFIELRNKKTDFPVIIPLHQNVIDILAKRNGKFPRQISDQNFNDYIKIVAEKSGITEIVEGAKISEITVQSNGKEEKIYRKVFGKYPKNLLVTSHICRRSFATNLYGKIDTLTIMKITGHKTEKQFLDYIKITPKEYAEKLREYWKKQNAILNNQ
jgi:integrase